MSDNLKPSSMTTSTIWQLDTFKCLTNSNLKCLKTLSFSSLESVLLVPLGKFSLFLSFASAELEVEELDPLLEVEDEIEEYLDYFYDYYRELDG